MCVSRLHFPEQQSQDLRPGKPSTHPHVSLRVVVRVPRWWGNLQKELCGCVVLTARENSLVAWQRPPPSVLWRVSVEAMPP